MGDQRAPDDDGGPVRWEGEEDGAEATTEIIRSNPAQKIIFVSADVLIESDARNAGAAEFLPKPFRMDDLIEKMQRLSAR